MNNKFSLLLLAAFLTLASAAFAQQKVSILGDSYSTYHNYVTSDTYICWYGVPNKKKDNDVKRVEDTWWHRLIAEHGYQLEQNNSYSGATICNTGYNKADYSDRSFVTRMDSLGNPDVIFVFGGTNDSWAGVPIGEYQYSDWTKKQLYSFRPAFCYLLDSILKRYPQAKVYNISNSDLSDTITNTMEEICRHYGITNIRLHDIEKQSGHPSVEGMKNITQQVWEAMQ